MFVACASFCLTIGLLALHAYNCNMYDSIHNLFWGGCLNKDGPQWCNPSDPVCLVFMGVLLLWLMGTTVHVLNKAINLVDEAGVTWGKKEGGKFIQFCVCTFNEALIVFTLCLVSIFCSGVSFFVVLLLSFTYVVFLHIRLICLVRLLGLLGKRRVYSVPQTVMACAP